MRKRKRKDPVCVRISPEERLCPEYDCTGSKCFPTPDCEKIGMQVMDNFPEEHIQ